MTDSAFSFARSVNGGSLCRGVVYPIELDDVYKLRDRVVDIDSSILFYEPVSSSSQTYFEFSSKKELKTFYDNTHVLSHRKEKTSEVSFFGFGFGGDFLDGHAKILKKLRHQFKKNRKSKSKGRFF